MEDNRIQEAFIIAGVLKSLREVICEVPLKYLRC